MTAQVLNPFIYGKPVSTGRFFGRQEQVRVVFGRLFNGESTAIVGEPHIGKTSLLKYIADEGTRREWINQVFDQHIFVDFDCHLMAADFAMADFWGHVLEEVRSASLDSTLTQMCDVVAQNQYGSFTLERLFKSLAKREWRVVLLIDEFDTLLNHPNFATAEFLGALRSLATRTDSLAVITASRMSVTQMNRLSLNHNPLGSPFFNNMTEVRLPQLNIEEADLMIDSALRRAGGRITFTAEDRAYLLTLAGCQPFLLQVAAASLYDAKQQSRANAYTNAGTLFHERAAAHFEDLARALELNDPGTIHDADRIDRVALRQKLIDAFDPSELELMCFDLGVDYDDLGGDGKSAKAVKLILYCQRRSKLGELREKCRELRPKVEW